MGRLHSEEVILNTLAGDDHVLADDTSTVFTPNGGEGNDISRIGQVFNSPRMLKREWHLKIDLKQLGLLMVISAGALAS